MDMSSIRLESNNDWKCINLREIILDASQHLNFCLMHSLKHQTLPLQISSYKDADTMFFFLKCIRSHLNHLKNMKGGGGGGGER